MRAQILALSVLVAVALAQDDLVAAESAPHHYDYYPAHASSHGYDSHGLLSKGHDSHGHGHYADQGHEGKSGYDKHGSHLIASYGDHG
ncbi:hypothetical protein AVEN_215336-1, partial [Araneus ventricosus]